MSYRSLRLMLCGALAATLPLAGCTADPDPSPPAPPAGGVPAPAMRLVAFDSCEQLRDDLRKAASKAVGPYGLPGDMVPEMVAAGGARTSVDSSNSSAQRDAAPAQGTAFSGTNTHEQGVDEPDLVKTDGKRIVTVSGGVLRVVDAATRRETGKLDLGADVGGHGEVQLLLFGDSALVLAPGNWVSGYRGLPEGKLAQLPAQIGPQLLLVSLTGAPSLVSTVKAQGRIVDARQVGGTARVVLRTAPTFDFRELPESLNDKSRIRKNREVVEDAPAEAWLPEFEVTTGGNTDKSRLGCDRVSRPADYSATSLVTVLTFDLGAAALSNGDPVAVVADGDTVYGTGTSLYVATDQRWRGNVWRDFAPTPEQQRTEIYRFDIAGAGRPTYAAAGSVPGWLINQYALSEWDGHLRVATTSDSPVAQEPDSSTDSSGEAAGVSSSAVRVLRQEGGSLVQTGAVEGLGKGERIYSVRFVGARGYVVTFRQTDPLYSVDLSDPAKPAVTGELKITGYSAHLQPAGEGRLIGIGQEADTSGRTQGTQVSYFDVTDPKKPTRLAQHKVTDGHSDAEYDPHALLWWPATNLLVVPMTTYDRQGRSIPTSTALALRVTDAGLSRVGDIAQPALDQEDPDRIAPSIRRSLVIGDVLWTVSDAGLQASDLSTLKRLSWLPTV